MQQAIGFALKPEILLNTDNSTGSGEISTACCQQRAIELFANSDLIRLFFEQGQQAALGLARLAQEKSANLTDHAIDSPV